MEYQYIKFAEKRNSRTENSSLKGAKNILVRILGAFFPVANPDFDPLIDKVNQWLIEIDMTTNLPNREIGIDKSDEVIMIMPCAGNYGYWTDNNLTLKDFKTRFDVETINKEEFEKNWKKFNPESF